MPINIRISGCGEYICKFYSGQNISVEVDFINNKWTSAIKPTVKIAINKMNIKYSLHSGNNCNSLKVGKCPLKIGEFVTYATKVNVPKNIITPIRPTLKVALWRSNGEKIFCVKKLVIVISISELKWLLEVDTKEPVTVASKANLDV
ncbi:uncharacterized protein LOC122497633 [Leptopilina heterotoma]|uniref:uncharacterized protein LOC122497633 n=1 Tax=Leptopilina heterotoma TaxID=63436 RepID=UPI001CA85C38|nr:uncharacterized protein LOC122497633 [Leptopilina heterotoma]